MEKPLDLRLKSLELANTLYGPMPPEELVRHAKLIEEYLSTPQPVDITSQPSHGFYDSDQLVNLQKCMASFADFLPHAKIVNPNYGIIPFIPYGYQTRMADCLQNNGNQVIALPRQMGGTTMGLLYALWKALTRPGITVVFMTPRQSAAVEANNRARQMLEDLPSWLRTPVSQLNKTSMSFDNNSRILFKGSSADALRGYAINTLIIDQASFISDKEGEYLWHCIRPTMVTKGCQTIAIGLPTRDEGFMYDMHMDPSFVTFTASWQDHPSRDAQWRDRTVGYLGEETFNREYQPRFGPTAPEQP